ncbi:MAG: hypothetical protein P1U46_02560 [Patescibacteria group bacterium]|nr:hypothetical protein [Patescibacteria group bacterium]
MLNIRAYKVTFPNGKTAYESKNSDNRGSEGYSDIKSLASYVKHEVQNLLNKNDFLSQVTIDLFPFHDIEHPSGIAPIFCSPLSEEEKKEFWDHYNS